MIDQSHVKTEVVLKNADELIEKFFAGLSHAHGDLVEKLFNKIAELRNQDEERHMAAKTDTEKLAGKLRFLEDKLLTNQEEQKAREKLKDREYLSEKERLKLEESALRRQISGYKTYKENYTEY